MTRKSNVIEIHTSDRQLFKRCRRKFGLASTLRDNLVRLGPDQKAFFIGSGVHFALEDYWGWRKFDHPALAFAAYFDAQKEDDLPDEAEQALTLATGMLTYYVEDWLQEHPEPFQTLWLPNAETGRDEPQIEIEVAIPLNDLLLEEIERRCQEAGWTYPGPFDKVVEFIESHEIVYVTTYDRVTIDDHERIAGVDYKTAAQYDIVNLLTNPQARAYDWSMDLFYSPAGFKPRGIWWYQFKKAVPVPPRRVNLGKKNESFSLAENQSTTYRMYRKAVWDHYGTIPDKYYGILADLGNAQDDWGDPFIRLDLLSMNDTQREVEQRKIIAETLEMLDPHLPLYPNPTKDCGWDCAFKDVCLAMDDGADYEWILEEDFAPWQGYRDDWRRRIVYPKATNLTPA